MSLLQADEINGEVAKPLQKRKTFVMVTQTININCQKRSHV